MGFIHRKSDDEAVQAAMDAELEGARMALERDREEAALDAALDVWYGPMERFGASGEIARRVKENGRNRMRAVLKAAEEARRG